MRPTPLQWILVVCTALLVVLCVLAFSTVPGDAHDAPTLVLPDRDGVIAVETTAGSRWLLHAPSISSRGHDDRVASVQSITLNGRPTPYQIAGWHDSTPQEPGPPFKAASYYLVETAEAGLLAIELIDQQSAARLERDASQGGPELGVARLAMACFLLLAVSGVAGITLAYTIVRRVFSHRH